MAKHAARVLLPAILGAVLSSTFCQPLAAWQGTKIAYASVGQATVRPPLAWPDYCARHPSDCTIDLTQPVTVVLDSQMLKEVQSIDASVNATVQPITDLDHWRVQDRWDLAEDGYGDCEDYALRKRRMLVRAGIPRRAMLMTVVKDQHGAGHAVLMIRTDQGDLILDDMNDRIVVWSQTGYAFVKRESQYTAGWVNIDDSQ
jgi:predicted transglutaminase-like cysteine proteinase